MRRIGLVVVLALSFMLAALAVEAQEARKGYRVGILSPGRPAIPPTSSYLDVFRQSLADSGYFEGTNVSFEYRWSEGDFDRIPGLASELVRLGVDVLFSVSTPAIRALAEATTTIPIVIIAVADPV